MPVVYVVIASSTTDSSAGRGSLKSGVYPTLSAIAPFIAPEGPPLPLIIQCFEDQVTDLRPLADAIRRVGGGDTVEGAERFVKAVIEEVGAMSIWPEASQFYGLLRSSSLRKFIGPDYGAIANHTNGTQGYTIYKFTCFVDAFIYILAGGNTRLKRWGLPEWQGVGLSKKYSPPEPSLAIGSSSTTGHSTVAPPLPPPRRLTPLEKTSQSTAGLTEGGRAGNDNVVLLGNDDVGGAPAVPSALARHTSLRKSKSRSSLPSASRLPGGSVGGSQRGIQAQFEGLNIARDQSLPQFPLPPYLVPPSFLAGPLLQSDPLRFMTLRPRDDRVSFTLTNAAVVGLKNGPIVRHTDLPTMAFLYLRAHGWSDDVIAAVNLAYTGGVAHADFLNDMGRQHRMPLTEASFLWYMVQYFGAGGS